MTYVIRSVRPDEWRQVKELRLDALRDPVAHLAFLETYEESVARTDEFWQDRTAGAAVGVTERQQIVAMTEDGEWVGSVTVLVELAGVRNPFGKVSERDQGHLVGVFVRPEHRGSEAGVTQGLFDAALAWSWGVGLDRVRLFVHEKNGRAEAFYRKAGFVPTGETEPMPGTTGESQLEFVITRD
ncbi:GNAT family N-acetyltransferase [Streptomyces sp. NPDC002580]|uniref:GNAT family N-acetyltransferase n=1 Tax=Streptomyces sp. NPDC002580 TaxID=3364653 RepID=UPI00368E42B6